ELDNAVEAWRQRRWGVGGFLTPLKAFVGGEVLAVHERRLMDLLRAEAVRLFTLPQKHPVTGADWDRNLTSPQVAKLIGTKLAKLADKRNRHLLVETAVSPAVLTVDATTLPAKEDDRLAELAARWQEGGFRGTLVSLFERHHNREL